jgi:ATP-binding cassette subfamily C (CFTR/MRP) protein 10
MVGDRGVTLSGGQKARISLARALYQDLDIYLIDDPFASVDIHVAEHIYSKCILGLLKNKSKIVCTHHPKYLLQADIILNLDSGQITAKGPSNEILKSYALEDFNEVTNSSPDKIVDLSETEDDSKPEYKEEEREEGVVKLDVYITYLKSVGIYLSTFILFSILFMQISRSASDCWLAFWTSSNHLNASYGLNNSTYYLIVFITIAAINSVLTLIRAFIFAYGGVVAALKLHYKLLTKIFRAPVLFFDLTAFGRIINRFSTDIFNLDDALPFTLNIFLSQLYSLLASLIITIYGLPYIALVIIPLSIPYYFIQVKQTILIYYSVIKVLLSYVI